ncbi:hypothetical protein IFM89_019113 [Coptis chinensis]|uniref:Uncharacterized protein n=1 Tax=Coptis chinensis TaxID=261450 RepID=A0A835HW55_9MAGN|nr:hypothetical protein IFM89_019113 [Coptis chinensis]
MPPRKKKWKVVSSRQPSVRVPQTTSHRIRKTKKAIVVEDHIEEDENVELEEEHDEEIEISNGQEENLQQVDNVELEEKHDEEIAVSNGQEEILQQVDENESDGESKLGIYSGGPIDNQVLVDYEDHIARKIWAGKVYWDPYKDVRDIRPLDDVTFFNGVLCVLDIAEGYNINRVLRQVGYVQRIPGRPIQPKYGSKKANVRYNELIATEATRLLKESLDIGGTQDVHGMLAREKMIYNILQFKQIIQESSQSGGGGENSGDVGENSVGGQDNGGDGGENSGDNMDIDTTKVDQTTTCNEAEEKEMMVLIPYKDSIETVFKHTSDLLGKSEEFDQLSVQRDYIVLGSLESVKTADGLFLTEASKDKPSIELTRDEDEEEEIEEEDYNEEEEADYEEHDGEEGGLVDELCEGITIVVEVPQEIEIGIENVIIDDPPPTG